MSWEQFHDPIAGK